MLKILNTLLYILGGAAIIALPFMVVNHVKYVKVSAANRSRIVPLPAKFPVKSVIFFVGPIILAIVIAQIVTSYGRYEVLSFLREVSGDYKIYVNSQPAHEPQRIVDALKEVAPQLGHKSHPTKMFRVEIQSDKGNLRLELGRDSVYAQEYWMFYPKYGITSNNEIGRVTTSVFDEQ
jgi:type IV secretory pathway VirB6-like protein